MEKKNSRKGDAWGDIPLAHSALTIDLLRFETTF